MLFVIGMIVSIKATSRSVFCASCHEMRYEYNAWQESSHSGVSCEECHMQEGFVGMIRTKLGAMKEVALHARGYDISQKPGKAEVPDATCLRCHQQKMRGEIHYHLLRMTHQAHLDRGIHCTDCHASVVHGGKAPYKNTPQMTTCFKCHDGQQAPNNCSLCHVKLGEIRPQLYNPQWVDWHKKNIADTGQENCTRCHGGNFCMSCHTRVKPHNPDWIDQHRKVGPEQLEGCKQCHPARGDQPMAEFCQNCHAARRAHSAGYVKTHMDDFRQAPDTCARCHKQEFCADCHKIYMPHPSGWIQTHPQQARQDTTKCQVCHTSQFCQSCHLRQTPQTHSRGDWIQTHQFQVRKDPVSCRQCHEPQFCQACHRNNRPATHNSAEWGRAHGGMARVDRRACETCHGAEFCNRCHQLQMPHPVAWPKLHQTAAVSQRPGVCKTCHTDAFCAACHQGTRPVYHDANWARTHGNSQQYRQGRCAQCHTQQFCASCHKVQMPHSGSWSSSHGQLAAGEQGRYCGLCHSQNFCQSCHAARKPTSHGPEWRGTHGKASMQQGATCTTCHAQQFCANCHKLQMPHPDNWVETIHKVYAPAEPDVCLNCHQSKDCLACHEGSPPGSHAAKDFKKQHPKTDNKALCRLCHGPPAGQAGDACNYCHGGVTMPHPDDWATEGHQKVASFKKDAVCFRCHKLDDCKQCHDVK